MSGCSLKHLDAKKFLQTTSAIVADVNSTDFSTLSLHHPVVVVVMLILVFFLGYVCHIAISGGGILVCKTLL